jgi:predicted RNA-binding Zn ribbon-like protein
VAIGPDGTPALQPLGTGVVAALGTIVAGVPGAVADGSWVRAKVCPKDSCRWAFYDQSRNRSRRWCTMDVCGNREKTRAFRERQQGAEQD